MQIVDRKSASKTHSREAVMKASTEYFKGDALAAEVWLNKYCLKDSHGNLYELTPDDMHRRIAKEFARIEKKYPNPLSEDEIYSYLKEFKYIIPQGSPMAGIGNNHQIMSLSNCFVIGNDELGDSYGGIFKLDQEMVQLMKRRAGVGVDLSFIRPERTPVKNSALTSTGVVPFMERFSNSTREVAQGGRRGALMESISITHPDSEAFIDAKMTQGKVTGANVSVRITDDFMDSVTRDEPFKQRWSNGKLDIDKEVDAKKIWDKIVHNAWKSAEPGILFWDTIIKESIPDCYAEHGFATTSTNPCGEIPLCPHDSCRLLLLNLYGFIENPFTAHAYFNYDKFKVAVTIAQRLMDDLIDLELENIDKIINKVKSDPESDELKRVELRMWDEIKKKCIMGRRTGLGVTAEGDMLAALGMVYGTDKAIGFSEHIHRKLKLHAYASSVTMAEERGAFPMWSYENEKNNPFLLRLKIEDETLYARMMTNGRRNIALLTIAPAGSVSMLSQTTSGIECAFMIYYMRRRKINPSDTNARVDFVDEVGDSWQEYPVFHHKFLDYLKINGYTQEKIDSLTKDEIDELIKVSPYNNATSNDVNWVKKVEMQGRIQKHVDHSISVTVNLPNDISEEMVGKVYQTAWRSGCKGVTVYRDGSRSGVLVSETKKDLFADNHAPKRPKRLQADVIRFQNNYEKWIAFIGLLDDRPYEIFTGKLDNSDIDIPTSVTTGYIIKRKNGDNKSVYDFEYVHNGEKKTAEYLSREFNPEYWNYAKMISSVLRHGMPLQYVHDLIQSLTLDDSHLNTWKNGVARVVKKYIPDGTSAKGKCEECNSELVQFIEGCLTCKECGSSKCS